MKSEPLNQYTEIYRDAIKSSSAKLSKTFENQLLEILLLYMTIQRKINFTQMNQLDFSYNASFASQNVAKVMMKENGMGLKAVQACALRGCETWCLGAM